jgi:hypothetical protein
MIPAALAHDTAQSATLGLIVARQPSELGLSRYEQHGEQQYSRLHGLLTFIHIKDRGVASHGDQMYRILRKEGFASPGNDRGRL